MNNSTIGKKAIEVILLKPKDVLIEKSLTWAAKKDEIINPKYIVNTGK